MRHTFRLLAITIAMVFFLGAAVPQATALKQVRTKFGSGGYFVNGSNQVSQIYGDITSKKAKCLNGRTIVIKSAPGVEFGRGLTNATGDFVINGIGPRDNTYKFTAKRMRAGNVVCLRAILFPYLA